MIGLRNFSLCISFASVLLLAGCSTTSITKPATPIVGNSVSGHVHGGQQPVANSTIQLYAVGTSGDGSASTPLIAKTVTTDIGGNFNITGDYSCASATEVYITATGGNPGLASGNNPNLALMTALGPCSALTAGTDISINELTTVAATAALAPYMTSLTAVGSASGDASLLASAFTLAAELVDPAAGVSPGQNVPAGYEAPVAEIDTLGDIAASCVNSAGGVAGDGTACGNLFNLTTLQYQPAPTNTVNALLNVAYLPTQNAAALFALASSSAPFQPVLSSAPANFGVALQPVLYDPNAPPSSLSFGQVGVGVFSVPQTIAVFNYSASYAMGYAGVIEDDVNDFAVSAPVCNPSSTCSIVVSANPQAAGPRSTTLLIDLNNIQYVVPLFVLGVGENAGPLTLSATSLAWTIGDTYQDVTLANNGNTPVTLYSVRENDTGVTAAAGSSNFVLVNNCGSTLAAQSACTLSVQSLGEIFYSQGLMTPETYNGTLTIIDSTSEWPQIIALSSTNTQQVTVAPFSTVQVGTTSVGTANANSGSYYEQTRVYFYGFTGANAADFAAPDGGCEGTPAGAGAGESCAFEVDFTPSADGLRTADMQLGGNQYVLLTGYGVN